MGSKAAASSGIVKVKAEAVEVAADEAPVAREAKRARADTTTSSAGTSAGTAGSGTETLAAKVGRIREALGLQGSMPIAEVLQEAYKQLELPPPEAVPLPAKAAKILQTLGI